MSENVLNLITAISAGDAVETETAFNAAMAEKISAQLDAMRVDVAKSLFTKHEEVASEAEVEAETVEQESEEQ